MRALRLGAFLLVCLSTCSARGEDGRGTNSLRVISSVAELRALTRSEAAREYPVKLRGVVTFNDWTRAATFVHDGQDSTFVWITAADWVKQVGERANLLSAGTLVEVEGVSAPGDFVVCVSGPGWTSAKVRMLGQGKLPEPIRLRPEEFMEPMQDQRWVEVGGIIRQVTFEDGYSVLELDVGGYPVKGVVAGRAAAGPVSWQLVQVPVKLRGAVASVVNSEHQMTGRILCIPSEADIVPLTEAATPREAEAPLRTPATLLQADAPKALRPTRVQGVVTWYQRGQGLYIRGTDGSLWVQTAQMLNLLPGSEVEVVGLPVPAPFRPFVQGINVRLLGLLRMPLPVGCKVVDLFSGRHQGELVNVEADFVGSYQDSERTVTLQFREQGRGFRARLTDAKASEVRLAPGSRVRIAGICLASAARQLWTPQLVDSVEIRLRSTADLVVLSRPSWWTPQRLLLAVGLLLSVLLVAGIWVFVLQRRVAAQTRIIRQKLEREALWEERSRIAQDLHDDVGASLTQIANLGELATRRAARPDDQQQHLSDLMSKARQTVRALDEIVWTVSPRNDALPRSASYFSHTVSELLQGTGIRCRLRIPDELPEARLTSRSRHQVLLAVKEAVRNVIKHSGASELQFALDATGQELTISIKDNGKGFDPGATGLERNGLFNMPHRLKEVGGRFELASEPGKGTKVVFTVPMSEAK